MKKNIKKVKFFWKNRRITNKFIKIQKLNFLNSKFFNQKRRFSRKKVIYWPIYKKINKFSPSYYIYNSFESNFLWIKKSYKNNFFLKNIKKLKIELILNFNINFEDFFLSRKKIFNTFFLTYRIFFFNYLLDLNYFLFIKKKKIQKFFFFLYWTFKRNQRLYVNFQNYKKKNFLFLSHGFFLKYFEKKKSMKKNKSMKLLLARYLRKLFLLVKFKYTIFCIKKIPNYLLEILNILNTPIIHKFVDPFSEKIIEEPNFKKSIFNINYFIFFKNIDFSGNKIKKKGRIKRKITRKIVLENSIID